MPQATAPARPAPAKPTDQPDESKPADAAAAENAPASTPTSHGDANAPVGTPPWLIYQAEVLEQQRDVLQKKIGKNRDALRGMDELDALTDEQRTWVRTFYPEKEKGERRSQDEIEATRKVREAARKRK